MPDTQQPPSLDELRVQVSRMLDGLDPSTPIAATVTFPVNPEKEPTFVRNLKALSDATLQLPGVNVFSYHKHKSILPGDSAPRYLIYEDWKNRDLFRRQWDSAHLRQFQNTVFDLLTGPPQLDFYFGAGYLGTGSTGKASPVLATGQKRCWDEEGQLIRCAGSGLDGDVQAGLRFPEPRYRDNDDGTVTDLRTGLIWLKDANRFGAIPWAQGLQVARGLASGSDGLTDGSKAGDWRLPNINELQSLVDLDSDHGPAFPDDHPFENLEAANYWSSSTVSSAPALGWYIAFAVAPPVFDLKFNAMRIWPVRGGHENPRVFRTGQKQCYDPFGQRVSCDGSGQDGELQVGIPLPDPRFTDNGDGSVTDNLTGLVWLQDANAFGSLSWGDAVEHCNSLGTGAAGLSDGSRAGQWRLPNIHEMRSIIDYDTFGPAITKGHPFVNVRSSLYWSSTTVASAPNQARFVFVGIGPSVWDHKSVQIGVWPVRDGKGSGGGRPPLDKRTRALLTWAAS